MTLYCAVCLYVPIRGEKTARRADTVIEGYAVCEDHMGYVAQGARFHAILTTAKREHGDPEASDSPEKTT